jgi:hypothetical protein
VVCKLNTQMSVPTSMDVRICGWVALSVRSACASLQRLHDADAAACTCEAITKCTCISNTIVHAKLQLLTR